MNFDDHGAIVAQHRLLHSCLAGLTFWPEDTNVAGGKMLRDDKNTKADYEPYITRSAPYVVFLLLWLPFVLVVGRLFGNQ
jgi:hypothetical protein